MTKESHQISLKKKREFWRAHFDAWKESRMSQAEYCRKNGLSIKSFGYWKRKQEREKTGITFYPVPLNSLKKLNKENQSFSLRLIIDDRFKIEIGDEFTSTALGRLVQTLGRL